MNPVHLLILIVNLTSIFGDVDETKESISIIAQCADKEMAEHIRNHIAHMFNHGDRLVILSSDPSNESATVDTMCIVEEGLN